MKKTKTETVNEGITTKEQVYDLIFSEDDVTWKTIIMDLAKSGKIDPWDIEVSVLAQEYLKLVSKLKHTNFRLSGKVILAGALLLKLKADRIGLKEFIQLTNPEEFPEQLEDDLSYLDEEKRFSKAGLKPRIPGIRKRKVTVFELVGALKKALEVEDRRERRLRAYTSDVIRPVGEVKRVDVFGKIEAVFTNLKKFVKKFNKLTAEFTDIVPSEAKQDKIWTFISLLHLANEEKVALRQKEPFGTIYVDINEKELSNKLKRDRIEEAAKPTEIIKEKPKSEIKAKVTRAKRKLAAKVKKKKNGKKTTKKPRKRK